MKNFKEGDKVIHCDSDNLNYCAGMLGEIHNDENGNPCEADIYLTTGGSISPIMLEYCEKISDDAYKYLTHLEKLQFKIMDIAEKDMGARFPEG